MNEPIPVMIDPALEIDAAALRTAWDRDPQAQRLGALEERSGGQFTGVLELVVVPALVSVGATLIAEGIKQRLTPEQQQTVVVVVQKLPDGKDAVLVQSKPDEPGA